MGDTHNKSLEEIQEMYRALEEQESHLRQCIRERLSAILMDTSEENPLQCDIVLDSEAFGLSTNEMTRVIKLFQHPSEGIICFIIEGFEYPLDMDTFSTYDLITILKHLV